MDDPPKETDHLMSLTEIARYCGVSVPTVRKWVDAGLPTVLMPNSSRRRVWRSKLFEFLDNPNRG